MNPQTLHEIDEELTKSEVAALKFLCIDFVTKKRLEGVKDAKDLFLRLNELALLNDKYLLAELLHTIGRFDLLRLLGTNKIEVDSWLQNWRDSNSGVSPYRIMLYKLSEDTTDQNLRTVKFLLDKLPKSKLQACATLLDVLTEMEKVQMLGEDNLDELERILGECDKQLASRVQEFRNLQTREPHIPRQNYPSPPQQEESMDISNALNPLSIIETLPEDTPSLAAVVTDAQDLPTTIDAQEEADHYYSLTRRPRGYCLIISNYSFVNARPLRDRKGTDKDEEALTRIFSKLHFLPQNKTDLSSSAMRDIIKEFAEMDHSQMDAFVCCILSHGEKGTVLGTDGKPVLIRDLTMPFASCQSLWKKPKLFFIQACQGKQLQRPVYIQADGDEKSDDDEYEDDAQSVALHSIPVEADFLIGMATVESYKSFRHTYTGSIFIQELCKQLENGLRSKEDILSILTRVNREVSVRVLMGHKQMPEPRYTLTKKLVFTVD
ncbi:caspase-8 [Colossoma macropomum]|uniref:caspase-8 n=1 Tax=Colossoma macropomum TaxID=42526 RepID=UPI001864D230|nr:caspase-8 [Colossoma macropomum]